MHAVAPYAAQVVPVSKYPVWHSVHEAKPALKQSAQPVVQSIQLFPER